jgi:hypothetical protein
VDFPIVMNVPFSCPGVKMIHCLFHVQADREPATVPTAITMALTRASLNPQSTRGLIRTSSTAKREAPASSKYTDKRICPLKIARTFSSIVRLRDAGCLIQVIDNDISASMSQAGGAPSLGFLAFTADGGKPAQVSQKSLWLAGVDGNERCLS